MTKSGFNMKIIVSKLLCLIIFELYNVIISQAANDVQAYDFQLTACTKQDNVPVDVLFIHSPSLLHCAMLCINYKCSSVMFSNTDGRPKCSLIFDNQQIHSAYMASCEDASETLQIWKGCPVNRDFRFNSMVTPFVTSIYGGLCDEPTLVISGTPLPTAKRFSINLMCGENINKDDIALHIDVRFDHETSIRQTHLVTKHSGNWMVEQKAPQPFPFDLNKSFEMKIMSTSFSFNIIVNDQMYVKYQSKVTDMYRIRYLSVTGGVGQIHIRLY